MACSTPSFRAATKWRSHDKVLKATGLKFVLYDLRHTWATRMARVCPVTTLIRMLGHSDLRVVMRYVHPEASDAAEAVKAFEAARKKQAEKRVN